MSLRAHRLSRTFHGRRVLHNFHITVSPGEVHGLLGPNGAGKTTAFRILAGVEAPDAGEVWLGGVEVGRWPLHRRARAGLGYLPQEEVLLRDVSVGANVGMALSISGKAGRVGELLGRVGLGGFEDRRVEGLSGGERRRLALARLLAIEPVVLMLDEPFAGVDPVAIRGFQEMVRRLAGEGVAVLITDHAVRETLAICDRATVLDRGEVQVSGTPEEVAADPHARERYLGTDFFLR